MDVLLGSIDVRDLLSTSDLDETSPLSAPDLRLLIDRLQVRSLHIKEKVRSYVLSHHRDFADIFSRCSLAASSADSISSALADALRLLSDRPIDLEIRGLATEIRDKKRELDEKREALDVVRAISGVLERIRLAREEVRDGRLKPAAERLKGLKEGLRLDSSEVEKEEPAVFGFLRKEWSDCFDELQEVLVRNLEKAVRFEVDVERVTVSSKPRIEGISEVELHVTLEAMEMVGVLDYGLAKIADLMVKHVMNPAIRNGSINISVEEPDENSLEKHDAFLKLLPSSESQEHLDGPTIYARLIQIIKFIYKFICFKNGAWMLCFGRLTWPRMSDLIIAFFLSKVVPDDASKVADFQNIIKCTSEFEAFLKEIKFISTIDSKEERLSHFTQNVEVHFALRKRNEILAKARNILLQFDHLFSPDNASVGSMQTFGAAEGFPGHDTDLLFQPDRCFVSMTVSQLMELVHAALKDACLSSTRVAKEFYHAAKDALLLYKAIVPIKLEKQLDNISQLAIVIHNDFYYLSQEILGLSFEYRADFPSGLKKLAVFVDIAPNFYQMAECILQKQLQLVVNSLMEAIDGADGFQNTHQPQPYESAKFSIDQVVFILEKVNIIWEPLMPASIHKRALRILLDSVFSRVTKDMLLLDDIAAEETLQLQRLIHLMLENVSSLFTSLVSDVDEQERYQLLDKKIPSLCKFRKLADLLDMPLKCITASWENGDLLSCGFTASEVENFIKAIFTDSPLRKECLWRIESLGS